MDRYTGFAPCACCDGAGEWDEGPLPASSGATEPDYRQVICPECNGRGSVWHSEEHPRTFEDLEDELAELDAVLDQLAREHKEDRVGSVSIGRAA